MNTKLEILTQFILIFILWQQLKLAGYLSRRIIDLLFEIKDVKREIRNIKNK